MTSADVELVEALRKTTQALKDIINAAGNGEPYTATELEVRFTADYAEGVNVLQRRGFLETA